MREIIRIATLAGAALIGAAALAQPGPGGGQGQGPGPGAGPRGGSGWERGWEEERGGRRMTRERFIQNRERRLERFTGVEGDQTRAQTEARIDEMQKRAKARMLERFDALDADKNGVVTREERRAAIGAEFDRYDTDKNGRLSRREMRRMQEERRAAWRGRQGQAPGPGPGPGGGGAPGGQGAPARP